MRPDYKNLVKKILTKQLIAGLHRTHGLAGARRPSCCDNTDLGIEQRFVQKSLLKIAVGSFSRIDVK